jgi:hypothetical protein
VSLVGPTLAHSGWRKTAVTYFLTVLGWKAVFPSEAFESGGLS